jgi:hypothetical protein
MKPELSHYTNNSHNIYKLALPILFWIFSFNIQLKHKNKLSPTGIRTLDLWAMKPDLSHYTNNSHNIYKLALPILFWIFSFNIQLKY